VEVVVEHVSVDHVEALNFSHKGLVLIFQVLDLIFEGEFHPRDLLGNVMHLLRDQHLEIGKLTASLLTL